MSNHKLHIESMVIHSGHTPDSQTLARALPIYQTSSYVFKNTQHAADLFALRDTSGFIYTRIGNPTTDVLERRLAAIHGGTAAICTASGMSAIFYTVAAITGAGQFFIATMLFGGSNPFERLSFTPPDGNGLNPQLQNPGMMHPPLLYLGYIGITIPFAFAIAALMARRLDIGWIHAMRKWTILAWIFLSVGITLGMWWAYVELGWGGYWAWDPVENASLLPWLTMTAFLRSVMIQEKRGMLKRWNMSLVIGTFLLSTFGTFIPPSGVIATAGGAASVSCMF